MELSAENETQLYFNTIYTKNCSTRESLFVHELPLELAGGGGLLGACAGEGGTGVGWQRPEKGPPGPMTAPASAAAMAA